MRTRFLIMPLMAALTVTGQQKSAVQITERNMSALLSEKFANRFLSREPASEEQAQTSHADDPQENADVAARSGTMAPSQWKAISGSMNIYGMTVSEARPLQYEKELNAVSLVHRKPADYVPNPFPVQDAESGAIVAVFSRDWGSTWDTTLMWNSDVNWGRYPQGGIYNPSGNNCMRLAQFVATGPVTIDGGGWSGSYVASKALDEPGSPKNTDTVSDGFADHLFVANTSPFPIGKIDFPSQDFTITDDGVVRSLGYLVNNVNGTGAGFGLQGASILKGVFSAGDFIWDVDCVLINYYTSPGGTIHVVPTPHMAWNESGTVGYVWFIGVRDPRPGQGDTLSNMGFQPIIFKTVNSGASWTEMPRMNFNDTTGTWNSVFRQIFAVRNDSIGIPFFNFSEGIDGVVDRNDRLHLVSTVVGTARKDPDSLGFTFLLTHNDGQRYNFAHQPGLRPYIFDFTETNQGGWKVTVIDSMSSEGPGRTVGSDGYNDNPWDVGGASGTDKVDTEARIQLSRTPDGRYIVYTWAESDTAYTFQGRKWNSLPNVKARMAEVGAEVPNVVAGLTVHPTEINLTAPGSATVPPYTFHLRVQDRATCHFVSPRCAVISNTASSGVALGLPVTVSNNSFVPLKQASPVTHWYLSANLNFDNVATVDFPTTSTVNCIIGVNEGSQNKNRSSIYPNPGKGVGQVSFYASDVQSARITVMNNMGQVVHSAEYTARQGENNYGFDLSKLGSGSYFMTLEVNGEASVHKLLITE